LMATFSFFIIFKFNNFSFSRFISSLHFELLLRELSKSFSFCAK
jgi:hypothetical protein